MRQKGYRSKREMWIFSASLFVVCSVIAMGSLIQEFSLTEHVAWSLAFGGPAIIGAFVWQRWGRERFPLPPQADSPSAE